MSTGAERIRPAILADVPELARLRYEFRTALEAPSEPEGTFVARCRRWMKERLSSPAGWRCWVTGKGPVLRGTVWLHLLEKLPNPVGEAEWHAYVSNLYVQPSARGRGLGSALLEAALGECDGRGVDAVILWPTPRSRSLYERHGFSVHDDLLERRAAGVVMEEANLPTGRRRS